MKSTSRKRPINKVFVYFGIILVSAILAFGCFWLTLNATEPDEPNKYHQFEINIWFQDIATNRFIFSRNTKFVDELFAFV